MIGPAQRYLALSVLSIMLGSPTAFAQSSPTSNPPLSAPGSVAPPSGSEWNNENVNRQSFREEMEQIRKEHEELEEKEDRLLDKCVNVSGTQASDCEQERQALRQRRDQLHQRTRALHEKMDAMRKERDEEHTQTGGRHAPPPVLAQPITN